MKFTVGQHIRLSARGARGCSLQIASEDNGKPLHTYSTEDVLVVTEVLGQGDHIRLRVLDGPVDNDLWTVERYDGDDRFDRFEPVDVVPARPLIDFSDAGRSRETLRGYAHDLLNDKRGRQGRLKAISVATLRGIATGEKVDAYAILSVMPDILSDVAGTTPARRENAKKARAICHVARAVIEAHADGLPVYAEGDRSRKIEECKAALQVARDELDKQTVLANDLRRETDRLDKVALGALNRVDDLQATLDYAATFLDVERAALVRGFLAGRQSK